MSEPVQKTVFVESITPASPGVVSYFQIASVERKTTQRGSAYLDLSLRDRTGDVPAKLWDAPPNLDLSAGQFVRVQFTPESYKDALQLKIYSIHSVDRSEIAIEDYIPASKRDRGLMLSEVLAWANGIADGPLRDAVCRLIADHEQQIRDAPAAKKKHQAYLGGLLEHILALCSLGESVARIYPVLQRDLLIAAAIVHDIGKIHELVYEDHIDYSRAGSLTGHIVQGLILWSQYDGSIDPTTRDHIRHIIASHHGRKEWGAAQVPMTREAHVFHLLDMVDAKVELIGNMLAAGVNTEGFTPYNHATECAAWNGK